MKRAKKSGPRKRTNNIMVRLDDLEFERVSQHADITRMPVATYLRSLAASTDIRVPRSLPASDRVLLANAMGALNEAGALLGRIVEELELGDVPLESTIIAALYETNSSLTLFSDVLTRLRDAAGETLSELGRA